MATNSVKLEVITPSKLFYQGEVDLVIVTTLEGDEGFMAGHSWACKLLAIGELWIQEHGADKNTWKVAAVSGGFVEVKDTIMIYTDAAEWAEDIDMERVLSEKAKAEDWLVKNEETAPEEHLIQAREALAKADTRANVAGGSKRH